MSLERSPARFRLDPLSIQKERAGNGAFFLPSHLGHNSCRMPSSALARIRELIAAARDARKRDSLARTLDKAIQSHLISRETLEAYEADLAGVDDAAWLSLKAEAVQRLSRIRARPWDALGDFMNEVKGYAHLKNLGCTDISFVARTYERKSPDLMATLEGRRVLCEVKTLVVQETPLSDDFLDGKLTWTIAEAKAQLHEFGQGDDRKIVYLVLRWDASDGGDAATCTAQLEAFLARVPAAGVEVTVFQRPAEEHTRP